MTRFRKCLLLFCSVTALGLFITTAHVAMAQNSPQSGGTSSTTATPAADDGWHFGVTPYIWFAGIHGTVGALGQSTSVHASFGDIFNYLNIGLMGATEIRKRRFLLNTDLMWMKLSDDKALPINELGVQSIKSKTNQFMLTPKVGYRLVDQQKVKLDALVGLRYWHLGQSLNFQPEEFGGVSGSANWVDVVAGAKIELPLSAKASVTLLGDAGGGGANSDYQVAGLLGYKVGQKWVLQGGYRYLDVDYRGGHASIYDMATTGVLLGATYNFK